MYSLPVIPHAATNPQPRVGIRRQIPLNFFVRLQMLLKFFLALALKKQSRPESFHCSEYTFYIQDF